MSIFGFIRRSFVSTLNLNLVSTSHTIHTHRACVHNKTPPHPHGTSEHLHRSQRHPLTRCPGFCKSTRQACQSDQGRRPINPCDRLVPLTSLPSRFSDALGPEVVLPKCASSSWTTRRARSSGMSRAPSGKRIFWRYWRASVKPGKHLWNAVGCVADEGTSTVACGEI